MKITNTDIVPTSNTDKSITATETRPSATSMPVQRTGFSDGLPAQMMKIFKEGGENAVAYTTTIATVTTITLTQGTEESRSSSDLLARTPQSDHDRQTPSGRQKAGESSRGNSGAGNLAEITAEACEIFEAAEGILDEFEDGSSDIGEPVELENLNEFDEVGPAAASETAEELEFIEVLELGLLAPRLAATVYNLIADQKETREAYGEWKESREQTLNAEKKILAELKRTGVPEEQLKALEAGFTEVKKPKNFTSIMPMIEKIAERIMRHARSESHSLSDKPVADNKSKDIFPFLVIQYSKCALNERVKLFNFLANCMKTSASSAEATGALIHIGDGLFDILGEALPGVVVANAAFSIAKGCFAIASEKQHHSLLQKERASLEQGSNGPGEVPVGLVELKDLERQISKLRIGREGAEVFGHVLRSAGKITSMAGAPQAGEVINGLGLAIVTGTNITGYFLNRKVNIAMGNNTSSAQLRFEATRETPVEKIALKGLDETMALWEQKYREAEDNVASIKALSVIQKICEKEAKGGAPLTPEEREKEVEKVRSNLRQSKTFLFGDTTLTDSELNRVQKKLATLDRSFYAGTHLEVLSRAKELFGGEHLGRLDRSLSFIDRVSHDARKEYNKTKVRILRKLGLEEKNPMFSDRYKEKKFINIAKADAKHMRNTIGEETQDLISARRIRDGS